LVSTPHATLNELPTVVCSLKKNRDLYISSNNNGNKNKKPLRKNKNTTSKNKKLNHKN